MFVVCALWIFGWLNHDDYTAASYSLNFRFMFVKERFENDEMFTKWIVEFMGVTVIFVEITF